MEFTTADLCDRFPYLTTVVTPMLNNYGGMKVFGGLIVTAEVFEDNGLIHQMLSQNGEGKVLVVDGGGSLRCALVGQQLVALAYTNKWAGLIVYGCIRDSKKLIQAPIGLRALNTHALMAATVGAGAMNVMVSFANTSFKPGSYLYADEDAIVVAEGKLL